MNRLLVVVVTMLLLVAAPPATAHAEGWLSKQAARAKAVSTALSMYLRTDDTTDWWVEPSYECDRLTRSVVECDYYMEYVDGTCYSVVRVRRTWSDFLRISFPYRADCEAYWRGERQAPVGEGPAMPVQVRRRRGPRGVDGRDVKVARS